MLTVDERESLFEELIALQRKKMVALAKLFIPHIVEEDLLQPFDFPVLEENAPFRYEEGVLEGLLTAQMAIAASEREAIL